MNRPRAPLGVREQGAGPPRPFLAQHCWPAPLVGWKRGGLNRTSECWGHVCGRRRSQPLQTLVPRCSPSAWSPRSHAGLALLHLWVQDERDPDGGWRQSEDSGWGAWSSGVMVNVKT